MTIIQKTKYVILPALLFIAIGILQIKFPQIMDNFDDGYTGRGVAGLIMLSIELFLMLTWGKVAGVVSISIGISIILFGLFLVRANTKYLSRENKNTKNMIDSSNSKTRKAIAQTTKAIAKSYLEEKEMEKPDSSRSKQAGKKTKFVGNTARSLAKRYFKRQ